MSVGMRQLYIEASQKAPSWHELWREDDLLDNEDAVGTEAKITVVVNDRNSNLP